MQFYSTNKKAPTASPIKFASEIQKATGIVIDDTAEIAKLKQKEKHVQSILNDYQAIKKKLLTNL